MQQSDAQHRIDQRQKQIDHGKNTLGYQAYISAVPIDKRNPKLKYGAAEGQRPHPQTPDVHADISKRAFEGQASRYCHGDSKPFSQAIGVQPHAFGGLLHMCCHCFAG